FARCVRSFLHECAGIAVQNNSQRLCDRFAFRDQVVDQLTGGRKTSGGAVMEKCERSDWVCGGVENQFGPLRTTRIGHGNRVHSRPRDQSGEFFDFRHRSMRRLKGSNPCIARDIETNVTGCEWMAGGKSCSANDLLYVVG